MKTINYAIMYGTHQVTDAEFDLVHTLYNSAKPNQVAAIKFIRCQYAIVSLKQAKDICDAIGATARGVQEGF